jgi:hypothetical protein
VEVEESTYKKLCGEPRDSVTLKNVMGGLGEGKNENHLQLKQWHPKRYSPKMNVVP